MTPTLPPSERLSSHAPDHQMDEEGLDRILDRILDGTSRHHRSLWAARRLAVGGGIAAAATSLAVLLPATLQSPSSSAAALDRLALTAAAQPAMVIPDGAFLHLVTVENPQGAVAGTPPESQGNSGTYPRTLESWTDTNGEIWRHDRTADGHEDWLRFHFDRASASGTPAGYSPRDLAALPTDDEALLRHLRPRVQGSSSNDEAVFVYLTDALRTGYAPPQTRRAMITALARLPHIETERTYSYSGQPCLDVRYTEPQRAGVVQSACFDERTASLVEDETTQDGDLVFRSVVTERNVVGTLPEDVRRHAVDDGPAVK